MDRLLDALTGLIPLPPTRFVSHDDRIDDESWVRLLEALRNNREAVGVRLRGCGIGCTRASQLAEVLAANANLEVLELPDNAIGEAGIHALIDALRLSNCTLKSVDLSGNPCSESAAAAMQELDTLLKRNRVIKKLPKTPPTGARASSGAAGEASRSANCTPAHHGHLTPQLPQSFLTSAVLTPHGLSFELEQRLQHLEEAEATIRSELEHARSFSSQSEVWQKKIDTAGQQIAAILALVDSRNLALEARLQAMEHWRNSAEQAWTGQSKVLEDMAAQLFGLMRRMQLVEGKLSSADTAASDKATIAGLGGMGVRSFAGLASSFTVTSASARAPGAAAAPVMQEMAALRERLERLETASATQGGGAGGASAGREERAGALGQTHRQQLQCSVVVESAEVEAPVAVEGAAGGCQVEKEGSGPQQQHFQECEPAVISANVPSLGAPLRAIAGSADPISDTDVSGSAATGSGPSHPPSSEAAAEVGGQERSGSVSAVAAAAPAAGSKLDHHNPQSQQQQQPPQLRPQKPQPTRQLRAADILLHSRRGVGIERLPNSPILWHFNTVAVDPGSCGVTPTHGQHTALPTSYMSTEPARPRAASPAPAASSSSGSQDSAGSLDATDGPADAGCSGFVMYAVAQRARDGAAPDGGAAAQRYHPGQADARDSVDFAAHLHSSSNQVVRSAAPAPHGGDDDAGAMASAASTPGRNGAAAAGSSPGTPPGSTFSVDAETVSLSVAMAGSAARPRAPAAAATTTTVGLLGTGGEWGCPPAAALAASTKDPSEQSLGGEELPAHGAGSTTDDVLSSPRVPAAGLPVRAAPAAAAAAADSVGTPGMSASQWPGGPTAHPVSAPGTVTGTGTGTSGGSLTPTSKPCPTASVTATSDAGGAALTLGAARPATHLTISAAAARRPAPVAIPRLTRPGVPAPLSPGGCEGHSRAQPHSLSCTGAGPAPTTTSTASAYARHRETAVAVTGPDREPAGCADVVARAGREATLQQRQQQQHGAATDDLGGSRCAEAAKAGAHHSQAARSDGCAASGSHPPHHPVAPNGAAGGAGGVVGGLPSGHTPRSWLPGRASLQGHSIRSLAGRTDSGAGHHPAAGTKPGGAPPLSRHSTACSKPAAHRPTSSSTCAPPGASAAALARAASSCATHDQPPRHAAAAAAGLSHGHRVLKSEASSESTTSAAAAWHPPSSAPADDVAAVPQGREAQAHDHASHQAFVESSVAARTSGGQQQDGLSAAGHDTGGSGEAAVASHAHGQEGAAAAAAAGAAQHQPHSSRGYRPGSGVTVRTLSSGAGANAAGPPAKGGGGLARTSTSVRNVMSSVAGATKRWM